MKRAFFVLLLIPAALIIAQLPACNNPEEALKNKNVREGMELSQKYCGSCHMLPTPDLLDKKTWGEHVLPMMGGFLGFTRFASDYISIGDTNTAINIEQWRNIIRYYVAMAPEQPLERPSSSPAIEDRLQGFSVEMPKTGIPNPATTMVLIQPSVNRLYFADGQTEYIYSIAGEKIIDSTKVGKGVSNLYVNDSQYLALTMGVLHPSDSKLGGLTMFDPVTMRSINRIDSLQRAVHASYADLSGDAKQEIIISEFGNNTGELAWFEVVGKGYSKHILKSLPGAVHTEINDFNKDGRLDIMALMAQADEGMFIFYNEGNGKFTEKRILHFQPSHGSNYFELADFNRDGFLDIIATNGDNGDYPPILKAYHGIRIYLNNKQNEFSEKIFLPVNGVGKVMGRDFDNDGDLDLASISYFPDYLKTPEESFIYWKNTGDLNFKPFSFSQATAGRWLTMDANDLDGDGDIDIVLGNAKFPLGAIPSAMMKKWNAYSPSVLILRNLSK